MLEIAPARHRPAGFLCARQGGAHERDPDPGEPAALSAGPSAGNLVLALAQNSLGTTRLRPGRAICGSRFAWADRGFYRRTRGPIGGTGRSARCEAGQAGK